MIIILFLILGKPCNLNEFIDSMKMRNFFKELILVTYLDGFTCAISDLSEVVYKLTSCFKSNFYLFLDFNLFKAIFV